MSWSDRTKLNWAEIKGLADDSRTASVAGGTVALVAFVCWLIPGSAAYIAGVGGAVFFGGAALSRRLNRVSDKKYKAQYGEAS